MINEGADSDGIWDILCWFNEEFQKNCCLFTLKPILSVSGEYYTIILIFIQVPILNANYITDYLALSILAISSGTTVFMWIQMGGGGATVSRYSYLSEKIAMSPRNEVVTIKVTFFKVGTS